MTYIQFFGQISKADSKIYGGKVASLGEVLSAGIPVPNGFGISIEAHREFAGHPFSQDFKAELKQAFRTLKSNRVAVRSSAVAEDASDASWAGQLQTYLNVDSAGLEQAIRKCWKSVEADHVREYAKGKKLTKDALLVGVGVQAMVDSEVSGVMFTANPVTKNTDEILIEAAYGLGEMVVQGAVTPDRYTIDVEKMEVSSFNINIKEKMMVYQGGRNKIIRVPEQRADRASLWEDEVLELARLGLKVAGHYGAPQDLEWARSNNKSYIVQARPITTL